MTLTKKNDIFMFFDLIEQIAPERVLDVGMFLKRIGATSKQMFEKNIDDKICLDAIDFFPEYDFPIYETIYHHIWSMEEIQKEKDIERYDMAFLIHADQLITEKDIFMLWLKKHVKYCVVTCQSVSEYTSYGSVLDIKLDDDSYGIIFMGEGNV